MKHIIPFILVLGFLSACKREDDRVVEPALTQEQIESSLSEKQSEELAAAVHLERTDFSALPGWAEDTQSDVFVAFEKTCRRLARRKSEEVITTKLNVGTVEQWQKICSQMPEITTATDEQARAFFEAHFNPYIVRSEKNETQGLFTGYYEASLKGSRTKSDVYNVPLHMRPDDLVMVDLGQFRETLKGQRIAGRVIDGQLRPYEEREKIVAGDWPHNEQVLVWVDNPVDAFFLQIQGSGIVALDDGTNMRVGYAGQNGHVYYAIGRSLIAREIVAKENMSMQFLEEWLENNPDEASALMNENKSYVFFRELDGQGPVGGENIELTAGRSLAIDHSLWPYGLPFFLKAQEPYEGAQPIARLMMGQDTGGAIRGAIRGDVFWGYGEEAEKFAGPMKSKGEYWVLLPKDLEVQP
jgi:membrane-bound lytic murein transglycosylase A